jgi:hypothetical protein
MAVEIKGDAVGVGAEEAPAHGDAAVGLMNRDDAAIEVFELGLGGERGVGEERVGERDEEKGNAAAEGEVHGGVVQGAHVPPNAAGGVSLRRGVVGQFAGARWSGPGGPFACAGHGHELDR